MPRKNINFELDFMKKDIFPRFTVKQFDDVSFNIKPKNQGLDYDTTGMTGKIFVGVNNDMFMQTTGITVSSNNIKVTLDKNMLQNRGRAYAEIELTDSNGTITSSSFIFNIDEKIGEGAKIPGEYEGFVAKYERLISEFKAQVNSTIDNCNTNINSTINNCNKAVDNKLNDVDNFIDNKILDIEKRFNRLTSSQQQDAEVIDARDGEVSLKARLDRDLYKDGISLSDRIEAIEGLKDSQNMKYETDKGYLVCKETKNGVIDDLKIEGKTLVNLVKLGDKPGWIDVSNNIVTFTNPTGAGNISFNFRHIKPNTVYTLITQSYQLDYNVSVDLFPDTFQEFKVIDKAYSPYIIKFTTPSDISTLQCFRYYVSGEREGVSKVHMPIILEGDHTQNPPSYFEGLMSVGEDVDKIEVLSNNKNLFSGEIRTGRYDENGTFHSYNRMWATTKFLLPPNKNFKVSCKRLNTLWVNFWTKEDIHIKQLTLYSNDVLTTPLGAYKCSITSSIDYDLEDLQIEEGTQITSYIPHQSDKKQILFYNSNGELEPIQELHEWDSIEKHSDNKWYYHKRSGKVVLNVSENWNNDTNSSTISPATYRQSIRFDAINMPNSAFNTQTLPNIISNSLPTVIFGDVYNYNHIGISISGTDSIGTHIIINNNFMNVTELKQWLQANNVTVVYQLAQEEVYELAPLHLDSYANETLILCNSGAISPKMEFSITSHINELVKAYGERVNLLEEKVYQYMVTQNRMQLASTYSADSVTFKVDYFSLCGDEENYDEDLYNLILNNILVGKDNYNYDKMFTMILDYASWNQISWEQFDILVGLMDMQHNPPVEELPTEDGIEEDIIENEETPVE